MCNEESLKPFVVLYSDVWTESQRLRGIIFRSLILKAWRWLLRARPTATSQRHARFLRPSLPIKSVSLLAIVAAFVLMHIFAGVMLIDAAVAVAKSTQNEARQSVASDRNDDLNDQTIIRHGELK